MNDFGTQLAQFHEQLMSEEYKAELALELEGVERGIQHMRSSMATSHGRDGPTHSGSDRSDARHQVACLLEAPYAGGRGSLKTS